MKHSVKKNHPFHVIELDSCDSTNNWIKENRNNLKDKLPVLVKARRQTAGRGRDNRVWESMEGLGLYCSFGFMMNIDKKIGLLPLAAGISVIHGLSEVSEINLGLKWPNDIIVKGKEKIGGILIENEIFKNQVFCITGIGVNINHEPGDFQGPLVKKATSLKAQTGGHFQITQVLEKLSRHFLYFLEQIEQDRGLEIIDQANYWSRHLLSRPISFHQGKTIIKGIFRGINHDGGVILEKQGGERKIFYAGEIL